MKPGLEDVVAAETILSHVDGENGCLIIRDYPLEDLAGKKSFEWVAAHLWSGLAEGSLNEKLVVEALAESRLRAWNRGRTLFSHAKSLDPIEGMRLLLSTLSDNDENPHYLITAALPVFVAGVIRTRAGQEPIPPDPCHTQAEDFLFMLKGEKPTSNLAKALETYMVTVCDHGLNASTFTARVIASTRAGIISSVIGALCALKGRLHGGAPGPVLDMLDAIGTGDRAKDWILHALQNGERLMGFGHRVYKVRDPRADVLKQALGELCSANNRLALAEKVERAALDILQQHKPGRRLETNVEFYTALLLEVLGFPRETFTAVFASGRVIGWIAHAFEQEKTNRIIRPQSRYVGKI